jgi:hypothetical protein
VVRRPLAEERHRYTDPALVDAGRQVSVVRAHILRKGIKATLPSTREESIAELEAIIEANTRYKMALMRIAESEEAACPHVQVALEALNT